MKKIIYLILILLCLPGCFKHKDIKIEAFRNKDMEYEILSDFDCYNDKLKKYFSKNKNIEFKVIDVSTNNVGYTIFKGKKKYILTGVYTDVNFVLELNKILKNDK